MNENQPVIISLTTPDEETAQNIACKILEKRLAACVQIIPGITSRYWWKGEIDATVEVKLQIKTFARHFQSLTEEIEKLHSYEVPEIIQTTITNISAKYLTWMEKEMS